MNLFSGYPYWLLRNGFMFPYEPCLTSLSCDLAIIGGGITSALIANAFVEAGADVIVLDRRHIGLGSTSASTAILQFETDEDLAFLSSKFGFANAASVYLDCIKAIDEIGSIAGSITCDAQFEMIMSALIASDPGHIEALKEEHGLRLKAGIDCEFLTEKEVQRRFSFSAHAAILSRTAAQLDPLSLTHGIFQKLRPKGLRIYDTTEVQHITEKADFAILHTGAATIRCKNYVFANGYESLEWLPGAPIKLSATFAVVSKPLLPSVIHILKKYVFWETARPYDYMRCTKSNRIILGGKDIPYSRSTDLKKMIRMKESELVASFNKRFPEISFYPDFSWAGTFAESSDGLPFIGRHDNYPHGLFASGFGGNGITFSQVAARLLMDHLQNGLDIPAHYQFSRNNIFPDL